jgi:Small metal-binding protein
VRLGDFATEVRHFAARQFATSQRIVLSGILVSIKEGALASTYGARRAYVARLDAVTLINAFKALFRMWRAALHIPLFNRNFQPTKEQAMMKYRTMIAAMIAGALTVAVTVTAQALEIKHKEEVVKLMQKAIDEGKGGNATALVATAKEARRLAKDSMEDRHSYIMQVASERLKKAIAEGEQGSIETATKFLQEAITEVTAEGRDTMTP